MKNNVFKMLKKAISLMALTVIVVSGIPVMANAAEVGRETQSDANGIIYANYSSDHTEYSANDKAPTYGATTNSPYGYVFGGWYLKDGEVFKPLDDTGLKSAGNVYAKFVPAYVLSVKCQNKSNAESVENSSDTTALKVISSLDSTNYKSYGFEMEVVLLNDDGTYNRSVDIASEDSFTKAYETFSVYKEENDEVVQVGQPYEPEKVFGSASTLFTTWGVSKIKGTQYSAIIAIKPCWTTIDGTKVYGLTKYAHVEDGLLRTDADGSFRYLNVPVNLRYAEALDDGVAAGVLSVSFDDEKMTYADVEGGRVFNEMAWAEKTDSVKLVGNTSDISDKNLSDIYANIRFKVRNVGADEILSGYTFGVTGEDFSTSGETQYTESTYNVWDVKY